ncbi:MAG TPA: hypothetical protein VHG35_16980 [Gemmatimonadales bacterium]|nr:hypothetical protein [Gemmatimonadales bacterium]
MPALRILLVLVAAAIAAPLSAQTDVPNGTRFIADTGTGQYYPLGCSLAAGVPQGSRLYYGTEQGVQEDGFRLAEGCRTPRLEDQARLAPPPVRTVPLVEPNRHRREGFWFNVGLGYGSLGCDGCGGREGGLSGGLQLGGSLSQKVLLGGATTGWTRSEGGVTLTVGTLLALVRFYPSARGGFFLEGGLGLGTIHVSVDGFGSDSEAGGGALVGLGYDIRVGENVSLTPAWLGFAARTSNADANVGQLSLGVTLH